MARKTPTSTLVLIACAIAVGIAAWLIREPATTKSPTIADTTQTKSQETLATGNSNRDNSVPQAKHSSDPSETKRASKDSSAQKKRPEFGGAVPTADQPFEDWLIRFGYDLSAADMISMFRSDMPAARKRRLLDFFVSESDEGYTFLSSQSGAEFLDQILAEKSTDPAFARRIGSILKWFSHDRAGEMSDQYESRFSKSSSETEKIGLISAVSDSKFLRTVAYDHRQPASVREIAADNLLQEEKDAATLKGLLSISDTQPALQTAVISSAVRASANRDELQNVIDVLKKEGMATPEIAKTVGEALAANRRSYWVSGMDPSGDGFLSKVIESYNSGVTQGIRSPTFP
jgi:hypothetical protein